VRERPSLPARAEDAPPRPHAPGSASPTTTSKKPKDEETYLRLQRDRQGRPIAMEVAIARFEPAPRGKDSPTVDLIGAVHIAEPSFFAELNKRFTQYDAVLYELVAPEGTRPLQTKDAGGGNPISAMQTGLTRLLDLQFQLEGIDYRRPNMVHADMSPEEFRQSMRQRGESPLAMFVRMLAYSMAKQEAKGHSGTSDIELLMALLNKNRALALKRTMAQQFEDLGGVLVAIEGPNGSTLISRRNAKAMKVLRRELDSGKRKLAIFYGAGHLPDLANRLKRDFGLQPTGRQWLQAWDMSEPPAQQTDKPTRKTPRPPI